MAKAIKSASSRPSATETTFASGGSGASETANVPKQVAGSYPMRQVTWYQINNSDLRSIGVAQVVTTFFAALGTFALAIYLEYNKDLALLNATLKANNQLSSTTSSPYLELIVNLSLWAWLICWGFALIAFVWKETELRRIKSEHGEPNIWQRLKMRW